MKTNRKQKSARKAVKLMDIKREAQPETAEVINDAEEKIRSLCQAVNSLTFAIQMSWYATRNRFR